ncbi:MAG: NAD(P)-dependent oxidoreductase [Desulfovibrionaceae bacterium]
MTTYGFLGLGIMGRAMAANLVRAGLDVTVWNRTPAACEPLVALGARQGASPCAVAAACDITFGMVSDPAAVRAVCLGPDGVAEGIGGGRGYVEVSTVDDETVRAVAAAVAERGGRFLEAPVSGTKKPAEDGTLVFLAAGDETLYADAGPALDAMGKGRFFLGPVGQGARMKLTVNAVMAGMLAALSEGLALGRAGGLEGETVLQVLDAGAMANPMFRVKGPLMLRREYPASFPLKHMQKDLQLAVDLGHRLARALPVTAGVNETFKRARAMGLADADMSAVHEVMDPGDAPRD